MKKFSIIIALFFITNYISAQKFEIYQGDTINYIDQNNNKQGLWIFFNDSYNGKISQKGFYKDNKKDDLWTTYFPDGQAKTEIYFKENRQYGSVKVYYANGNIQEQGYWKMNKWVGEYTYYYENGKVKYYWFFDDDGKRTGDQTYYYDNGQKQISGRWTQGKETGQIKEYYPNGNVKKLSNFDNGTLNGSVTEYYSDGQIKTKMIYVNGQADPDQSFAYQPKTNNTTNPTTNNNTSAQDSTQTNLYKSFNGTGYYKFVNDQGLVEREGQFLNGVLVDGKRYVYDSNGKRTKTAIIKDGKVSEVINE